MFRTLVAAVAGRAQALVDEIGEEAYLEQWVEKAFPTDTLRLLRDWLSETT